MGVGQTKKLAVRVISETDPNQPLFWSSSDTSVLTTDQNGNITGTGAGRAEITAKAANGVSDTIAINVLPAFVDDVDTIYTAVRGESFDVSFRMYFDTPIQVWGLNYVLYTAYLAGSNWVELASYNIDGSVLFRERFSGQAAVKDYTVSGDGHIVDVTLTFDTSKMPLMNKATFTVSVFPYDNFGTGGSIHDHRALLTITSPD